MKQIVVLSGKGGTGKTTLAAALAQLASKEGRVALVDADVDAANLELIVSPVKLEQHQFTSGRVAEIDEVRCRLCGRCEGRCRFGALVRLVDERRVLYRIEPTDCEGCSACFHACVHGAIRMKDRLAGEWFKSQSRFGQLFHARLYPAQENSGKLVTLIRQAARQAAAEAEGEYIIIDGPPGVGCPVMAASTGVDVAVMVTEPTVSGIHDLQRVLDVAGHFSVPAVVVINKHDLNPVRTEEIKRLCASRDIEVAGLIPYDEAVPRAMTRGLTVLDDGNERLSSAVAEVWTACRRRLEG